MTQGRGTTMPPALYTYPTDPTEAEKPLRTATPDAHFFVRAGRR